MFVAGQWGGWMFNCSMQWLWHSPTPTTVIFLCPPPLHPLNPTTVITSLSLPSSSDATHTNHCHHITLCPPPLPCLFICSMLWHVNVACSPVNCSGRSMWPAHIAANLVPIGYFPLWAGPRLQQTKGEVANGDKVGWSNCRGCVLFELSNEDTADSVGYCKLQFLSLVTHLIIHFI